MAGSGAEAAHGGPGDRGQTGAAWAARNPSPLSMGIAMKRRLTSLLVVAFALPLCAAESPAPDNSFGDALLRDYFQAETARLTEECLADVRTLQDWTARKEEYRRQLFDMLGLNPLPERTPLEPVVTGVVEHPEFLVEKVHFQSRPGLYVTGNLYRPRDLPAPAPAILYVCGHGAVKKDGVSYGNKTSYQHHGAWFARHGYVCLAIDTIQLGEIEGLHHGTYREGMWWWHARGYTPAGVEAWNCIRALDYLQSRPEVDPERLGVTGRSGGGAYSWWIAALDERIKAAVPVAGITSLKNHVVDGCIEGHCDCMYMVNTDRWDFPLVAALVAPRPLLISNTDKDRIFPLDGVYDVYVKTRRIYELYGAGDRLGLHITEGPHKDAQELRVHAFVWFDRFLRGETRELNSAAPKLFEVEQLKVFDALPADERVTTVQEWFVPRADVPTVPTTTEEWTALRDQCLAQLRTRSLDECPPLPAPCERLSSLRRDGLLLTRYRLFTDDVFPLDLYVARAEQTSGPYDGLSLDVLRQEDWERLVPQLRAGVPEMFPGNLPAGTETAGWQEWRDRLRASRTVQAWFVPRGVGATEWTRDPKKRTHILRRLALLGKTLDELRTYDVVQAMRALRGLPGETVDTAALPLTLRGRGEAAGWTLFAAILEPQVQQLILIEPSTTLDAGPILLNARRYLETPVALALAAERASVVLSLPSGEAPLAQFARATAAALGWGEERVRLEESAGP